MQYLFITFLFAWFSFTQAIAGSEVPAEAAPQKESIFVGQLQNAMGEVVVSADNQMTQALSKGALLKNDTTISTGEKSLAVLWFNDGQIITMQANTSFKILDYHYIPTQVEKSNLFFYMLKGSVRAITGLIGRTHPALFRMETRDATIGIRGTDFMAVLEDQLYLQVTSGSITMGNPATMGIPARKVVLNAGEAAAVASASSMPVLIKPDELPREIFTKLQSIPVPKPIPIEIRDPPKADATPASAPAATVTKKQLWATHAPPPVKDFASPEEIMQAKIAATAKEREKLNAASVCAKYGYSQGSAEFNTCMDYAKSEGFAGEKPRPRNTFLP